jgi:hypothetical protein
MFILMVTGSGLLLFENYGPVSSEYTPPRIVKPPPSHLREGGDYGGPLVAARAPVVGRHGQSVTEAEPDSRQVFMSV